MIFRGPRHYRVLAACSGNKSPCKTSFLGNVPLLYKTSAGETHSGGCTESVPPSTHHLNGQNPHPCLSPQRPVPCHSFPLGGFSPLSGSSRSFPRCPRFFKSRHPGRVRPNFRRFLNQNFRLQRHLDGAQCRNPVVVYVRFDFLDVINVRLCGGSRLTVMTSSFCVPCVAPEEDRAARRRSPCGLEAAIMSRIPERLGNPSCVKGNATQL